WEFQRLPSAECQSKTTGSRPWLKLFRRSAAEKCAETATTLMLVSVIGFCRRGIIALQKCSDLLFLSQFIRRLCIELLLLLQLFSRDLRQMADEVYEFPAVFILFSMRAKSRHARKADAVVNDVEDLAVRQVLCLRAAHIGRFRIQALPDFSRTAAIISVAERAVVGEMGHRFGQYFRIGAHRIFRFASARRHRKAAQTPGGECFKGIRLVSGTEPTRQKISAGQSHSQAGCENHNQDPGALTL